MIRIGEWASDSDKTRKLFWCEVLKLPIDWVIFPAAELGDLGTLLKKTDVDGIFVSMSVSDEILQLSSRVPSDVRETGCVDALVRLQGKLWLRCYLREALHRLILKSAPQLDTHAIAYITGSDAQARLCATVAVSMGFRKLILVDENQDQAAGIGKQLSKYFFNLDFRVLREAELTLQPNNGSLLLNTLSEEISGGIFEDLTYLNFLRKDGLVVHLPWDGKTGRNLLLEEAEHVGVRRLTARELYGLRDYLFLRELAVVNLAESIFLEEWSRYHSEKQTKVQ